MGSSVEEKTNPKIKLMTNTKTVEQKENRSTVKNLDKMNSFTQTVNQVLF
jgi:hypothetical protein